MTDNITSSESLAEDGIEHHEFTWVSGHHTIRVGVQYTPKYIYIYDHLGIESLEPRKAPLPITRTGCLSRFVEIGEVDAFGGPEKVVRMMLDEAASSPEWQEYLSASRQASLF
jgi:hypothetical protein